MRYFLFFVLIILLASCKPPLPVYFDQPIGTKVQGFDTAIAGNYLPLDDIIEKGTKEFSEKYDVKYDKILKKDTSFSLNANGKDVSYEDIKDILGVTKDSGQVELKPKNCDSIFKSFTDFNDLVSAKIGDAIDKKGPSKPQAGMVKISYDRILFISVDSLGNNSRDTLVTLSPKVMLTKYSGKYFLNFKTPYGWEIMQLEVWENKFLCTRPFYFTDYDDCTKSVAELTSSTKNIYPNLIPIVKENKVIGFRAVMNTKYFLEAFKKSESPVLMMRVK